MITEKEEIYNPYAVEINYSIPPKIASSSSEGGNVLDVSDIEIDKLCGNFCYNAYNNWHGLFDLVLRQKHLRKRDHYKIFKRKACQKLCIFESMDWVKLCFKNLTWIVKLKWMDGKVYLDRKWYSFAKAGNLKKRDTIVFQMTGNSQKFEVSVFESDILKNCNTSGIGHRTGVMSWFKMINENVLSSGQMEITRVVMQSSGAIFHEKVNLIMGGAETVIVEFCAVRNFLTGMSKLIQQYHVEEDDVLVFRYVSPSTFSVGFFKSSGMAFNYNMETTIVSTTMNNVQEPEVILISDSSVEMVEEAVLNLDNEEEDNNMDFGAGDIEDNVFFQVTLKRSHVDEKYHGVYLPKTLYSTFNSWSRGTTIRLICGDNVYYVAALRNQKICRLGRGWTEFTIGNEFEEGQILQFIYVADKTFQVDVV
ncbi:hypothetical protein DCAR_0830884 [Daucus carota subsp. sativus]|nr:hypothetical protein DCAR_0830884 [Daucus carota subsp. sativus]